MINQFAGVYCTQTWAQHIANGITDHGDDLAFGVGTPILAPFSGTVRNHARPESAPFQALYITTITSDADPSVSMEYMHLSQFVPEGHYAEGATIGLSGGAYRALGSGHATGPHVHVNSIINGVIRPYTDAFASFASTTSTPIPVPTQTKGQQDMLYFQYLNANGVVNASDPARGEAREMNGPERVNLNELVTAGLAHIHVCATDAEWNEAFSGLRVVSKWTSQPLAALPATLTADLAKAVTDAVKAQGVTVDLSSIPAAVDAVLADNFAAIPAAVRAAIIK
jgi:hypothetical protein